MKKLLFAALIILTLTISTIHLLETNDITKIKKSNTLVSGYSTYNENKTTIISIYYSLLAFLTIILFFNILFKKKNEDYLEKEIDALIKKDEEKIGKGEIKREIKEKETETDDEIFKKEEEKLVDEVKKEIVEEKEEAKEKPKKGLPPPLDPKIKEETISEMKKDLKEIEKNN